MGNKKKTEVPNIRVSISHSKPNMLPNDSFYQSIKFIGGNVGYKLSGGKGVIDLSADPAPSYELYGYSDKEPTTTMFDNHMNQLLTEYEDVAHTIASRETPYMIVVRWWFINKKKQRLVSNGRIIMGDGSLDAPFIVQDLLSDTVVNRYSSRRYSPLSWESMVDAGFDNDLVDFYEPYFAC